MSIVDEVPSPRHSFALTVSPPLMIGTSFFTDERDGGRGRRRGLVVPGRAAGRHGARYLRDACPVRTCALFSILVVSCASRHCIVGGRFRCASGRSHTGPSASRRRAHRASSARLTRRCLLRPVRARRRLHSCVLRGPCSHFPCCGVLVLLVRISRPGPLVPRCLVIASFTRRIRPPLP